MAEGSPIRAGIVSEKIPVPTLGVTLRAAVVNRPVVRRVFALCIPSLGEVAIFVDKVSDTVCMYWGELQTSSANYRQPGNVKRFLLSGVLR